MYKNKFTTREDEHAKILIMKLTNILNSRLDENEVIDRSERKVVIQFANVTWKEMIKQMNGLP